MLPDVQFLPIVVFEGFPEPLGHVDLPVAESEIGEDGLQICNSVVWWQEDRGVHYGSQTILEVQNCEPHKSDWILGLHNQDLSTDELKFQV